MSVETEQSNQIRNYTLEQWQPLLNLIPAIEQSFAQEGVTDKDEDIPSGDLVSKFLHIVYELPIDIPFNWGSWEAGRKMTDPHFDLDSVDLITKCKLITAIVRNDRFCEGALEAAFKSGLILRIIKSIKKEVSRGATKRK